MVGRVCERLQKQYPKSETASRIAYAMKEGRESHALVLRGAEHLHVFRGRVRRAALGPPFLRRTHDANLREGGAGQREHGFGARGLLEGDGGREGREIGDFGGDRERGVVGDHVQEESVSVVVQRHRSRAQVLVVNGYFARRGAHTHSLQVVLRDGSRLVRENVARSQWERKEARDVAQLVNNASVAHVDVLLVLLEAVQVTLHEVGLQKKTTR